MIPFDYQPRTRIVFGPGRIESLGAIAAELGAAALGARRVLVVSDPHIVEVGHAQRGIDALHAAGLETLLYDGARENPTSDDVEAGAVVARDFAPELIVGIGGGSSLDCAKGINFVTTNGGSMRDYWGIGKAAKPMLPSIAVPTTAGTGSETQSFALISDPETHVKMACGDPKAAFRAAILDPQLTVTQPPRVTALTGIDAIAHALETFVTKPRNELSLLFSREAWRLLSGNFARVLEEPENLAARGAMQLGACFAGTAIENSMLGAAHALANPLTAQFGVVHGQAVALMLPHVIRFNGEQFDPWYRELLEWKSDDEFASNGYAGNPAEGAAGLANFITGLVDHAQLATRLSALDIPREAIPTLAADALKQWTGTFNPRPLDEAKLQGLYEQAY